MEERRDKRPLHIPIRFSGGPPCEITGDKKKGDMIMQRGIRLLALAVSFLTITAFFFQPRHSVAAEDPDGRDILMETVDISISPPEKGLFTPGNGESPGAPAYPEHHRAGAWNMTTDEAGLVWVVVEASFDDGEASGDRRMEALEADIVSLGGRVELTFENLVQAWIPAAVVKTVEKWPEVREIRQISWTPPEEETDSSSSGEDVPLPEGSPEITSEGVVLAGAFDWHAAGLTGRGVKAAVIDTGFRGSASLLGTELPSSVLTKFYGSSSDVNATGNGTACAEIIHDMAPDAALLLVRPRTVVELGDAVTWCIGQGVSVISCGMNFGLDAGPGDGTGDVNRIVTEAVNRGVTWVTAGGDHALAHWSGAFQDSDGDGIHNFAGADEVNGITLPDTGPVTVTMNWNDSWEASDNDYDLLIYEYESGTFVAGCQREQDGDERPWESVTFSPEAGRHYGAVIDCQGGDGGTIHLSVLTGQGLKYAVSSTSLLVPGDNPSALTVGAVAQDGSNSLEASSSWGPTINRKSKPDLAGPSGVSTKSFGTRAFKGTAAACAHAAGAAALLKQANPSWNPARIKAELENSALDLGSRGKDYLYGSGLLTLSPPPDQHRLYFPHSATTGAWKTEAGMVNRGASTVRGTLRAYDNNGCFVPTEQTITLPPFGRQQVAVESAFSNPDDIGYLVFQSPSRDVAGYMTFYVPAAYRAAVPAIPESGVNSGDIVLPHIASDGTWQTGISLVNTTASSKTVIFDFGGGVTKSRTLRPRAHDAFFIRALFGNKAQPNLHSAVIRNAEGVIGCGLLLSRSMLSGVTLKDDTASSLDFPHIAITGGWETTLIVNNLSAGTATLTITSYDGNGRNLGSKTQSVAGKGKYTATASRMGLPAGTAWCRIASNRPVAGTCLISQGSMLASFSVTDTGGRNRIFPNLEKNGYTGIAFINPWGTSASVTLKAYSNSGRVLATKNINLGAFSKIVGIAESFFDASIRDAGWIGLSSNLNIECFQLNQTSDGKMLDTLEGL